VNCWSYVILIEAVRFFETHCMHLFVCFLSVVEFSRVLQLLRPCGARIASARLFIPFWPSSSFNWIKQSSFLVMCTNHLSRVSPMPDIQMCTICTYKNCTLSVNSYSPYLHLATSEMWCWSGGREYRENCLCLAVLWDVKHYYTILSVNSLSLFNKFHLLKLIQIRHVMY